MVPPIPKDRRKTALVCFSTISHTHCLIYFIHSDPLAAFLNSADKDLVNRARDVVANPIMSEIAKEDPQGQSEYQDAVRHQIVAVFQRVRLCLLIFDTLMEAYNASK